MLSFRQRIMKYLASLLLIASFVGIALFGAVIFDHNMRISDINCVSSAIGEIACPASIVAMTLHHISVIQALVTTTPPVFSSLLLLASLFFITFLSSLFHKNLLLPKLELLPERLQNLTLHSLFIKQKIVSWLSLFELSPAIQ